MASVPLCALVWTVLVWTVLVWTVLVWSPTSALLQDTVYAVAVSSRVTGGASETLCAHVLSPPEPLALRVTLEAAAGRTTVLLNQTVAEDFYRCSAFQVPMVTDSTVATVRVTLQGKRDVASKKTKVLIAPPAFLHLIQTDKPLYKPGQTVMFRVVSMDTGFIPFNEQYKTVELQDPKRNRIAQWLQRTAVGGILDLSHPMSAEAAQGRYTVTAWTHRGQSVSRSFDIKEYVLPKYAVNIKLPDVINILHREVPIQICGRYTYGKPVLGSVKVVVCRRAPEDICVTSRLQTDKTGCASHTITVAAFRPRAVGYLDMFEVEAEMEEHGTGVVIQASGQTPFSVNVRELTFENVADSVYKPGIPFEGKIKLSGIDRTPLGGEFVYLDVNVNSSSYSLKLLTENNGMAPFSLDTALWEGSVALEANSRPKGERQSVVRRERLPAYPPAHLTVGPFYSKSKSFVKLSTREHQRLCEGESQARAEYIIQGTALRLGQEELNFYYIVMSKGAIMRHGHLPVAVKNGIVNKGVLSIPLLGKAALSPFAQVVVYTLMPSGEVLADSEDFPVDQCFKNRVKLEFSADRELPGGEASFRLESHPGSLCSVRAVDRSVLLLQPDQELTAAYVFNQLPVQKLSGYSEGLEDQEDQEDQGYIPCIPNGEFLLYDIDDKTSTAKDDVYSVFKEIGIKLVSIAEVKKPVYCNRPAEDFLMYEEFIFYKGVEVSAPYDLGILPEVNLPKERPKQPKKKTKETVRSYFPETWIWDLIPVGDGGSERVVRTLPDTITSWRAQAFCTSALGFGLSPDAPLLAFQPFFVSLTLPYSVVRGEEFTLRASVFNYLPSCIMVRAELNQSSHFSLRECAGCQYTMCVCAEESGAFQWLVKPSSLGKVTVQVVAEALHTEQLCGNEVAAPPAVGRVDTVVRTLLVEAEGTPVAVTHNALLCPGAEKPAETNVSLLLPDLCVAGSARASFSVLGDLMGRSMKNLDQLLAMPFGCGEQNMILFAPNIYILDYLSSTGQLTPAITERARGFLQSGYQRELTYRHDDGSYSAFGKSDASGNTWLTAFVMKSFGGAKPYIFIDPKQIESSRDWLFSHLRQDGCIVSVGKLFHNGMKGGVSDEVSLTAYTTAALLELDAADPTVPRCLQCLRAAVEGGLENTYTMALLSYAFSLAGDQQTKTALLTALHNKSITDGAMRHWKRAEASEKVLDSLEVETTAYVLLAVLSGPPVPGFDLTYASGAARWLLQQQNPYGGFASTQDTVVALQALARYGAASFSPEVSSEVGLSSLGGARWNFTVDESTRLLYQEQALDQVPGDYHITAQGQGCVQAQITLRYNVPPPGDFSSFHILTATTAACSAGRPSLTLRVDLRYQGRREETNMVILNLKLLSGYVLQQSSLPALRRTGGVKRVDLDQGYINIYLDGLKKEVLRSYSVVLEEEEAVRNLRPAVVKVYDYYQTGDEAVADYSSPCAEHD